MANFDAQKKGKWGPKKKTFPESIWTSTFCKKPGPNWSFLASAALFTIYTPIYEVATVCYISQPRWQRNIVQRCAIYTLSNIHAILFLHLRFSIEVYWSILFVEPLYTLINCPTRWYLLLFIGYLCRSSISQPKWQRNIVQRCATPLPQPKFLA